MNGKNNCLKESNRIKFNEHLYKCELNIERYTNKDKYKINRFLIEVLGSIKIVDKLDQLNHIYFTLLLYILKNNNIYLKCKHAVRTFGRSHRIVLLRTTIKKIPLTLRKFTILLF